MVLGYTAVKGVLNYGGDIAFVKFDINWNRDVAKQERGGKWSPLNLPGGFEAKGTVTVIVVDGELHAASINETPTTGTAEELKTGRSVAADGWVDNTDTVIATPSRIRITVETSAITTEGYIYLDGEDAAGNHISDVVYVGLLGVGEFATSRAVFLKGYGTYNHGIRSTGVGTLKIHSIAGDSTVNVGSPKIGNLIGSVVDGASNVTITCNNVFFTGGGLPVESVNTVIKGEFPFVMRDADADFTLSYA